jgi:serine/threonine protein kinase
MGTVYLAEHASTRAKVAIKVLRAELGLRAERVDRILGEMVGTARARHERLVETLDSGRTQDGDAFLVMEYVDGQPLNACLPVEGAFDLPRATSLMLQILEGLEAAHGRGLIHRDLRPENIFLQRLPDGGDAIKIAEFGLTRLLEGERAESSLPAAYLSPEQCRGKDVDARSDLYSAGCIFYFLLTREPPFVGKDDEEMRRLHIQSPPPSLRSRNAAVPQALEQVLMACLAKAPEERFQSAMALSRALREAAQQFGLRGPTRPSRLSQPNLGSVLRAQPLGVTAPVNAPGPAQAQAPVHVQVHPVTLSAADPVPTPISRTVSGVAMHASSSAPVIAMPAEPRQQAAPGMGLGVAALAQENRGDDSFGGDGGGSGGGSGSILVLVLSLALLGSVVGNVLLIGVISRRAMDTPPRPILMEGTAQREERPAPPARTEEPPAADRGGPGQASTRVAGSVVPRQEAAPAAAPDLAAARTAAPDAGARTGAAAPGHAQVNATQNAPRPGGPDLGAGAAAKPAQATTPDLRAKMVEVDRMLERGQFGPAREVLERMLPEHSDRPEVFERLGACAVAQRRYQAAEEYYERALDLKPDYAAAFIGLADLAERRGNELHALEWYRQYLRDAPQGPYAKLAQGRIRKLEKLEAPRPDAAGRDLGAQEAQ